MLPASFFKWELMGFFPRLPLLITGYYYYPHISSLFSVCYLDIFDRVYVKDIFGLNKLHIVDLESFLWLPSRTQIHCTIVSHREYRIQNPGLFLSVWHMAPRWAIWNIHSHCWPPPQPPHDERNHNTLKMDGYEIILEFCQNPSAFWVLKIILMFNARRATENTAISLCKNKTCCSLLRQRKKRRVIWNQMFFFFFSPLPIWLELNI